MRRRKLEVSTHLSNVTPPRPPVFSNKNAVLGVEEGGVARRASDGDRVVEPGEAEVAEGFGDEEEMSRLVKRERVRGRRGFGSSKEGVLDDSFEDLER